VQVESIERSPNIRSLQSERTDACHVSLLKYQTSISNGRESVQVTVNRLTARANADDRTLINAASGRFQRGIYELKQ
jgi:hypothetical protein